MEHFEPVFDDAAAEEAYERLASEEARVLIERLEAHHPYSALHSKRVAWLAGLAAARAGLEPAVAYLHALLHDVGKAEIPIEVLAAERRLSEDEESLMRSHAALGGELLAEGAEEAALVARHHHERFDGHGYPDGLAGEAIPLEARLVAICDSLEAMTAPERRWRAPLTLAEAYAEVEAESGRQFDPRMSEAVLATLTELKRPSLGSLESAPAAPSSNERGAPGPEVSH